MTEPLALRYRPSSFEDMIGQKISAAVLARMVETSRVPHGLLLSGPKGTGKTSAARLLAAKLGYETVEVDAASHGSVEAVRQMIETLRYGNDRIVIYDEAHSMSREAYNALLKTLEEPPSGTVFVLVTTEPERIPETVKSRLMEFVFHKVSAAEIYDRLVLISEREGIETTPELLVLLAERADGSVRDAIMTLDQCWLAGITDVETFKKMSGEHDEAPRLLAALMTGDHSKIFKVAEHVLRLTSDPAKVPGLLINLFRDLLILKAGGEVSATGSSLNARRELTLRLETERILAALKILWDLRTKIRASADARGNLDLSLVLVSEILTRGKKSPPPPAPAADPTERRVTLSEM